MEKYYDYAATCPVDEEVLEKMKPFFNNHFSNTSSMHSLGELSKNQVDEARESILEKVNGKNHFLIFTGTGTEANNLALKGIAESYKGKGKHILISKIEHDSVLNTGKYLKEKGYDLEVIQNDSQGFIDFEDLKQKIRKDTILVSIIHGNNEIGTLQDLEKIGSICKEKEVFFHTDACQSFCKTNIDLIEQNIDLITINAHKIYGPKGIGALIVRKDIKLTPLVHGGGHENNLRSGTLNLPGIIGFKEAINTIDIKEINRLKEIRDYIITEIENYPKVKLLGPKENRLVNNVCLFFENIESESLLQSLDLKGYSVSTGSACLSNNRNKSHVVHSLKISDNQKSGIVRISLGKFTTLKETKELVNEIKKIIEKFD
jgi:cysteine desulfurase